MKVELLNEDSEVLLTVSLDPAGVAVWEGSFDLSEQTIYDTKTGEKLSTKDGARYLRALPFNYRSPYLWARLKED